MSMYLGDWIEDSVHHFIWSSNDANGAAITWPTNGEIRVYKDDGTTESTVGITNDNDFDGVTGIHHCKIDTSAAAFYARGHDYSVCLVGATIDTQTINACIATFSIENRAGQPALQERKTSWYVSVTGLDANDGKSWGTSKLTIGAAVDVATSGDTIRIGPGTYTEAKDASAKSLRFIGSGWVTKMTQSAAVITLDVGDDSLVQDMTVENTKAVTGAGGAYAIRINSTDRVAIRHCQVLCTTDLGIRGTGTDLIIEDCVIVAAEYGISLTATDGAFIRRCRIRISGWTYCNGGGLALSSCDATVHDVVIDATIDNASSYYAAAMIVSGSSRILMQDCSFNVLAVAGDAHGIKISGGTMVVFNSAFSTTSGVNAYDIYRTGGYVAVHGCYYDDTKLSGTVINLTEDAVDNKLVARKLDRMFNTAIVGADVTDNSFAAKMVSSSATADWDSFVNTTDGLQAIRDNQQAAANAAMVALHLDHILAVDTGATLPGVAGSIWHDLLVDNAGTWRLSAAALGLSPACPAAPLTVTTSPGTVSGEELTAYQYAGFSYVMTIVDSDGTAVDLSGKSLSFIAYDKRDESIKFTLTTAAGTVTIGGDDNNQVTITGSDTNTGTARHLGYVLRNTTDDTVLSVGTLTIEEVPDAS